MVKKQKQKPTNPQGQQQQQTPCSFPKRLKGIAAQWRHVPSACLEKLMTRIYIEPQLIF